jgi:hypothetical protein
MIHPLPELARGAQNTSMLRLQDITPLLRKEVLPRKHLCG